MRARTCTSRTARRTGRLPRSGCGRGSRDADRSRRAERVRALCVRTARFRRSACSRCADVGSRKPSTARRPRARAVILSHAFWQRRFGGDEAALGRELSIDSPSGNGTLPWEPPSQVVGIMPPDFRFLDVTPQPDIIIPVRLDPARQAHGSTLGNARAAQARRDADRGAGRPRAHAADLARCLAAFPGSTLEQFASMRIAPVARPLHDDLVGGVASMLWVLMGAIGAVLLIACANIANLMLVRADARRPEFAVRAALGAVSRESREICSSRASCLARPAARSAWCSPMRATSFLSPSARPTCRAFKRSPFIRPCSRSPWSSRSRRRCCSARSRRSSMRSTSMRRWPARPWVEREPRPQHDAQRAGRRAGGARARAGRQRGADDSNVSGVARRRSRAFRTRDDSNGRGFGSDRPCLATRRKSLAWSATSSTDRSAAGRRSAGFASHLPMEGLGQQRAGEDRRSTSRREILRRARRWIRVSPGYFAAMGTRLIAGRELTWNDIETGGRVAVISEDFARELAAEPADALGLRIRARPVPQDDWREVIGVACKRPTGWVVRGGAELRVLARLAGNTFGRPRLATSSVALVIRSERAGDRESSRTRSGRPSAR